MKALTPNAALGFPTNPFLGGTLRSFKGRTQARGAKNILNFTRSGDSGVIRTATTQDAERVIELIKKIQLGKIGLIKDIATGENRIESGGFSNHGGFFDKNFPKQAQNAITDEENIPILAEVLGTRKNELAGFMWANTKKKFPLGSAIEKIPEDATADKKSYIIAALQDNFRSNIVTIEAIAIAKKFQRHGYGRLLYLAMLQELQERGFTIATLEIYNIFSFIRGEIEERCQLPNSASIGLHESFGAMRIGSVGVFAKELSSGGICEITSKLYALDIEEGIERIKGSLGKDSPFLLYPRIV